MFESTEKVILFPGKFDPPNKAHTRLLQTAVEFISPLRALVLLLSDGKEDVDGAYRKDLVSHTIKESIPELMQDVIDVDPFEDSKCMSKYMKELHRYFHISYPKAELYLLLGSSRLRTVSKWRCSKEVKNGLHLLVGSRTDEPLSHSALTKYADGFQLTFLPYPISPIKTKDVVSRIAQGGSVTRYLTPRVASIIAEKRFYAVAK